MRTTSVTMQKLPYVARDRLVCVMGLSQHGFECMAMYVYTIPDTFRFKGVPLVGGSGTNTK